VTTLEYIVPPDNCGRCNDNDVKLKRCTNCFGIAYCSRECQAFHWKNHKKFCTDIAVWNLVLAIEHNDLDLIQKYARTSSKIVNGCSKRLGVSYPIFACVRYDNVEALRILLESGNVNNIDITDADGDTALHLAASKRNNTNIMNLLLEHGANPNHKSHDGFSVLMMAARDFDLDNTQCILDAGVSTDVIHHTIGRIQMIMGGAMLHKEETTEELLTRKQRTLDLLLQYV